MSMRIFGFAKFQVFNVTNLIPSTFNFPPFDLEST